MYLPSFGQRSPLRLPHSGQISHIILDISSPRSLKCDAQLTESIFKIRSGKISYSPHNKKYNTDNLITFGYYISGTEFRADENQIEIEIMDDIVIRDNIEELKLREVYQVHADLVQECIKSDYFSSGLSEVPL